MTASSVHDPDTPGGNVGSKVQEETTPGEVGFRHSLELDIPKYPQRVTPLLMEHLLWRKRAASDRDPFWAVHFCRGTPLYAHLAPQSIFPPKT